MDVDLSPIARFFVSGDELLARVEPTWWGAVVTDPRFPAVHDLNYARIESAQPDLTLEEVERAFLPAARAARCRHFHVVVFETEGTGRLLDELTAAGHTLHWDTVMAHDGAVHAGAHAVEQVEPGEELWRVKRRGWAEFGVTARDEVEQLTGWAHDVLAPAGKRWFGVRADGSIAGLGSLMVRAGVGYVDDVVTFPAHRRRGIAGAIVARAVSEGRSAGADPVMLLADDPGPIRLYERLGFREVGRLASVLAPLYEKGSSGSL